MHARGDYSDFKKGEIYPDTYVKVMSEVFTENGYRYVLYTCTRCNSGILYKGRIDNIRRMHTWRCAVCGRKYSNEKPKTLDYERKAKSTKENINPKCLKGKHIGEIRGDWLVQSYDHGDHQGHSFYNCLNIKTGAKKISRFDQLPHEVNNTLKNVSNGVIIYQEPSTKGESSGENAVKSWLIAHNILFDREYSFEDLTGVNNGQLRFDFKIKNKNIFIEFQGIQHYQPVKFFGGEDGFTIRKIHDNLKKVYCNKHGYHLIEIPYNYENLDDYLLDIL